MVAGHSQDGTQRRTRKKNSTADRATQVEAASLPMCIIGRVDGASKPSQANGATNGKIARLVPGGLKAIQVPSGRSMISVPTYCFRCAACGRRSNEPLLAS